MNVVGEWKLAFCACKNKQKKNVHDAALILPFPRNTDVADVAFPTLLLAVIDQSKQIIAPRYEIECFVSAKWKYLICAQS